MDLNYIEMINRDLPKLSQDNLRFNTAKKSSRILSTTLAFVGRRQKMPMLLMLMSSDVPFVERR